MNPFGHFDDNAREYVITRPGTPLPWLNYLGQDEFFGLCSKTAGGYSFWKGAKMRRLTRYRYNNFPYDLGGRYIYADDGGSVWNPGWKPIKAKLDNYECRHGLGCGSREMAALDDFVGKGEDASRMRERYGNLVSTKPRDPSKHQYNFDSAAVHAFLQRRSLITSEHAMKAPACSESLAPRPVSRSDESNSLELAADSAAWLEGKRDRCEYDVLLCHNSEDRFAVAQIGEALIQKRIVPWLDQWDLRPGLPWQETLEGQIKTIKSAAVFVGKSGLGPWQEIEISALLRDFVRRHLPVIPVILSSCDRPPKLPTFLEGFTWVDFRESVPEPLGQLIWGITGRRPH